MSNLFKKNFLRILLDSTTDLDMPPEMTDISNYCATLGHKVILAVLILAMRFRVILVVMMKVVLVESMLCADVMEEVVVLVTNSDSN